MNITIEEIKEAREDGHNINSLIEMLERKQKHFDTNKHWFVFQNGGNVCEFCGERYAFSQKNDYCLQKRINNPR